MSEVQKKSFQSKTLKHLDSYTSFKKGKEYLLSYGLINKVYQYAHSLLSSFLAFVTKFSLLANILEFVDGAFEKYVLGTLDAVLSKVLKFQIHSPASYFSKGTSLVNQKVLSPVNTYIYDLGQKYLPAEGSMNGTADLKGSSEITKFFKIINDIFARGRVWLSKKSTNVSEKVITDYKEGIKTLSSEENKIRQKLLSSYNSGVKIVNDVNSGYIQPLKSQTQDYISDVARVTKSKADSYLTDTKNGIAEVSQVIDNAVETESNIISDNISNPVVSTTA